MTDDKSREILMHVETVNRHGTDYVTATPMAFDPDKGCPCNLSWSMFSDEGKQYSDMELSAHISDYDGKATLYEPEYRTVHSVDLRHAEVMVKVLKRLQGMLRKAEAREAGDVFAVFCKALGVGRVVWHPAGERASWLSDHSWHYETVARGRDLFRQSIREIEAKHPKNAKAA